MDNKGTCLKCSLNNENCKKFGCYLSKDGEDCYEAEIGKTIIF